MTEIEKLIPHRAPFLFVDEIMNATTEEIIGIKTFDANDALLKGSFPGWAIVPGVILIESMAQCGGAGVRSAALVDGLFGLASIESATFYKGVEYGKTIQYVIKNLRISEKIIKQSGIAYVDGEIVMEASWMCLKIG